MKRIFISYARVDKAFVLRFAQDLRASGTDIWLDQLDIPPGAPWDVAVEAALKECPIVLIVLSPRSVASQNVLDEVHYALGKAKKILPVMYEACELPMRLARLQYIDFTTLGYDSCLKACVEHVKALFDESGSQVPESAALPATSPLSVVRGQSKERIDGKRILWVDDRPRNNRYERKTIKMLGAEVHLALDTRSAELIASEIPFHLFISDMDRPPDVRAGYTLLKKLQDMNINTPYVIYAGSNSEQHKSEAIRAGAIGCTNNPYELLDLVIKVLSQKVGS